MFILLDIDGVMTPANTWRVPQQLEDGFFVFKKEAVEALKSLLSPSAHVVLTTSHRERFTIEGWKQIFATRGIQIENLQLISDKYEFRKRKDEIEEWVLNHENCDYIVIDDDKFLHALPPAIKEHVIITNSSVGLLPEDLDSLLLH